MEGPQTSGPPNSGLLLHQLFERRAQESPSAIALEDPSSQTSWTYGSINRQANELARRILMITNHEPEVPVAILLPHSASIITASLAALKAGSFFVPLDPANSRERLAHIVSELGQGSAGRPILIAEDETELDFGAEAPSYTFLGFPGKADGSIGAILNFPEVSPTSLAYIIYTSGSTGVAKGVMVEHSAIVGRLSGVVDKYGLSPADCGLVFLNPAFDASLLEVWAMLAGGGRLILPREAQKLDLYSFVSFVERHRVSRLVLPACFAERLWSLDHAGLRMGCLKTMFVGGDQVCPLPASFYRSLPYSVINCYGPTEATVQALEMNLTKFSWDGSLPPIGYPIQNVAVRIRPSTENPEEGELLIGGHYLARGYWNNPTLTQQKFFEEPDGSTWYATGDIVRRSALTGAYTWLRRLDDQIKVNGFLVEPAEVERVMLQELGSNLSQVKVIGMEGRILAFLVLIDGMSEDFDFRARIAPTLPKYLQPSFYITLPKLPTTPNGKVDKRALEREYLNYLAKSSRVSAENENGPKVTKLESSLTSLWSRVLNLPSQLISATSDVFHLGGDSLQLTQIRALLKSEFGLDLPAEALYGKSPLNVGTMAQMVASRLEPIPV